MDILTQNEIKDLLRSVLLQKVRNFKLETEYKPFFQAVFSPKQILIGAVIQSTYTSFGMSLYEQIAVILAKAAGYYAERQYKLMGTIDYNTENMIASYWEKLKSGLKNKEDICSNKIDEIDMIRNNIKPGQPLIDGDSTVDLYIKCPDGYEFFIDITTVKNNLKSFEALKLKMLRWVGLRLSTNPESKLNTYIAIPYNPYHPKPYMKNRWNAGILDGNNDILIQEKFWNFVGNDDNTFNDLIVLFKEVGEELEEEINNFFNNL